jgi:hypothetical protein
VIEAYGTAETEFRRTSTAYDVVDRTMTVTAPLDGAAWWTVSEYDELGRPVEATGPDDQGRDGARLGGRAGRGGQLPRHHVHARVGTRFFGRPAAAGGLPGEGRRETDLIKSNHRMPIETDRSRLTVQELANRFRHEMIPLSNTVSYFSAAPMVEEELKQYLQEPIAAIPPTISASLPPLGILLVPYLERADSASEEFVVFEKPGEHRQVFSSRVTTDQGVALAFATKEEEVADYHYLFYNALAGLVADNWKPDARDRYYRLLREELKLEVHGEVDEHSWHQKQGLLRRQTNIRKETKLFRDYARQSFVDTLTLYLHGICCDIDVETGPRQLPSRYLRRRLELFLTLYPPPQGYAVFPDQPKARP